MGQLIARILPVALAIAVNPVPIIAYMFAPGRVGVVLARAKVWLARYDRPILRVVFLAIGVLYTAKGLAGLVD